jgi:hypothetical protein
MVGEFDKGVGVGREGGMRERKGRRQRKRGENYKVRLVN